MSQSFLRNHLFKAVIWDMDGVIINTEARWSEIEREAFTKVGVPVNEDFENATTGLRAPDVVAFWHKKYPWDSTTYPLETIQRSIITKVQAYVQENGQALPGVVQAMTAFADQGLKQAIASSSPVPLIETVITKLNLVSYIESMSSGEDEKFGKPAPDVYLSAASKLGVDPKHCLVIEDSVNGALAGSRAGMKVAIIPSPDAWNNQEKIRNYQKIPNATLFKNILDLLS